MFYFSRGEKRASGLLCASSPNGRELDLLRLTKIKKEPQKNAALFYFGGDEEDRTLDLRIANATLSQLSYIPEYRFILAQSS